MHLEGVANVDDILWLLSTVMTDVVDPDTNRIDIT